MISNFFVSPIGAITIVVLLLVALYVAIGATPGRRWAIPRRNREKATPTPEAPQQLKPTPSVGPAPPKQEPKPSAPASEPSPDAKPEAPCAKERQEIEELTDEIKRLKKPKPLKEVMEKNVSDLLAEFGKINSKGERDLRYEAEQSEPAIERVLSFLKKFATHLSQTGYDAPTPEKLMKLLWGAAKAYRQKNPR